ncbi:bifunctional nicotinamidase/pyrazinamidase [Amaricoccus tamworthensis]|uniref:bifunctional nicotinamidase/pyrazinamidase n=1 Tax=Amaricoccus tamworthensis TaxID=57002 RepID=UPI003C7E4471
MSNSTGIGQTALVAIDVQNDFCPGGALAVEHGHEVVEPINAMMPLFDVRVLTQDWHPVDHSSFASNHAGADPFSKVEMEYGPQVLWPSHCVQETDGASFHSGLRTDLAGLIVRKGYRSAIDSYSAFMENDKSTTTGLAGYLRELDVRTVYFAGLATDFCVAWSAMDAVRNGFASRVILDASRAIDLDGSLDAAMASMRDTGVEFVESSEILAGTTE